VSEQGVLPGLWPIHGEGVLARQGDLVLLVHPAGGAFTDRLLDLLTRTAQAGESGRSFADLVSAECESNAAAPTPGDDEGPAAVAFGPAAGGTAFTVYGTAWAEVTTARGTQRLGTGEPYGRLTYVLPSTLVKVRAGVRPPSSVGDTDPYLRLADGVVRAVAFVYAPAEVPPTTEPSTATQPPAAAAGEAAAPVEAPAEEQFTAGTEPPGDAAPPIGAVVADLVAGGAAAAGGAAVGGLAEAADVGGQAEMPSQTSLDPAWQQPEPAAVDSDSAGLPPVHSPTSLDASWQDLAPPPGPAPVDADFGDQAPVHIPTSLDVSWRSTRASARPSVPGRRRRVTRTRRRHTRTARAPVSRPDPAGTSSRSRSAVSPSRSGATRCRWAPNRWATRPSAPPKAWPLSSWASTARTGISTTRRRATAPSAASGWPS
jgi:hypothetical protein